MKYKVEFQGYPLWVRMFLLDDDIQEELSIDIDNDPFEEMWGKFDGNYDYNVERELAVAGDDKILISVKDENDNVVFKAESIYDIKLLPTFDDDEEDDVIERDGYGFEGVEDGTYLVRQEKEDWSFWEGDLELDTDFDPSRLYLIRDKKLNDEFCEDACAPMGVLYYQKADNIDPENDNLDLEFLESTGSKDYWYNISSVEEQEFWDLIRED